MRVQDFKAVYDVATADELETILAKRYGDRGNQFWLSHGNEKYPLLLLSVRGDKACLWYAPEETSAGFSSVGEASEEEPGTEVFFMNEAGENIEIPKKFVVPVTPAIAAAKEF